MERDSVWIWWLAGEKRTWIFLHWWGLCGLQDHMLSVGLNLINQSPIQSWNNIQCWGHDLSILTWQKTVSFSLYLIFLSFLTTLMLCTLCCCVHDWWFDLLILVFYLTYWFWSVLRPISSYPTLCVKTIKYRCLFFSYISIFRKWKCIHLKVLRMITSGHHAGSTQQHLDPAVQHFDMSLNALEREEDLSKKKKKFHGIPLTFSMREHKRRIDLMSEKIVLGICQCCGHVSLAWFPQPLIRNGACFLMPVCVPSKAYHHSNYSSEGDEHCQHSISEL